MILAKMRAAITAVATEVSTILSGIAYVRRMGLTWFGFGHDRITETGILSTVNVGWPLIVGWKRRTAARARYCFFFFGAALYEGEGSSTSTARRQARARAPSDFNGRGTAGGKELERRPGGGGSVDRLPIPLGQRLDGVACPRLRSRGSAALRGRESI